MRRFLPGAALALLLPASAMAQSPRLIVELEGGPVWQSYNDVEVPNDGTATRWHRRLETQSRTVNERMV